MITANAAIDFITPVMLLARETVTKGLLPPVTGRTPVTCLAHVTHVRRGLQLGVRVLRLGHVSTSLLAGNTQLVKFGGKFAKTSRQSVGAAVRVCAAVGDADQNLATAVAGMIRDATDVVDALRVACARLVAAVAVSSGSSGKNKNSGGGSNHGSKHSGGSKTVESVVAGGRLAADLLLASLQQTATMSHSIGI